MSGSPRSGAPPVRILVVGSAGFVGRHLAARAARAGHDTLATARAAAPGVLPFVLGRDRIGSVLPSPFTSGERPAAAVICAAESRIDLCAREPEATRSVNVEASARLVSDLAGLGVRSVVLSTDNVFDGAYGAYDDTAVPAPVNEYGRQKLALEQRVLRETPGTLVLRLSKIVGDDPAEAHPFSEWWGAARRGETIRCIRGQVLSPTWVEDVADGILLALGQSLAGLWHLAAPEPWSRAALARLVIETAGLRAAIVEQDLERFGFTDRRPLNTSLDGGRFARATGARFAGMREVAGLFVKRLGPPAPLTNDAGNGRMRADA